MSQLNPPGRLEMFAALKYSDYRLLWYSSVTAGISRWAIVVGQGWLVFQLSGSAVWVGVTVFANMLPFVLAPLLSGSMADRFERRSLLATTYILGFCSIVPLAFLTAIGQVTVWHVVVLAFAGGIARSVEIPTIQSLVPNLVPRHHLLNGVALNSLARHGTQLIGPALAGPLLGTVGPAGAFVVAAIAYAVGAILALRMDTTSRGEAQPINQIAGNFMQGVHYLYTHSMVALMIVLVAMHCSLTMSYEALLPTFTQDVLEGGGPVFSYMVMSIGGGALIGTLALATLHRERLRGHWLLITSVCSAIAPILLSISTTVPMAMTAAIAMGASQFAFMSLTNAMIQAVVPDALRGRISSLYLMQAGGTMAFANLLNGYLASMYGASPILLISGTLLLIVMASASTLHKGLRRVYNTGVLPTT